MLTFHVTVKRSITQDASPAHILVDAWWQGTRIILRTVWWKQLQRYHSFWQIQLRNQTSPLVRQPMITLTGPTTIMFLMTMWAFAGSIIAVAWSTSLTNVKTRCFSQSECVHNIDVIILWSYCNRGSHWKDKVAIHENCIRIIVVISKKIKCLTFSEILYCSINLLNNLVPVPQKLGSCNNISPLAYFPLRIIRATWIASP